MKRRGFLGIAGLTFTFSSIAKSDPKEDYKIWETGSEMPFKNYGVLIPSPSKIHKNNLECTGILFIKEGYIFIDCFKNAAKINDLIAVDKTDELIVVSIEENVVMLPTGDHHHYRYKCQVLQNPKKICGRRVIKINGKWTQYDTIGIEHEVIFTPIQSLYREGGV